MKKTTQGSDSGPLLSLSLLLAAALSFPAQANGTRELVCNLLPEGNVCTKEADTIWREPPPKSVELKDRTLIVTAKNGKTIERKSSPPGIEGFEDTDGKPNVHYRLEGFRLQEQYFQIKATYWEGASYELVSYDSGESWSFDSEPIFSPDRKHLLEVFVQSYGDENTEHIKLYSNDSRSIKEIWATKPTNWPPVKPVWVSPSHVVFFFFVQRDGESRPYALIGRLRLEGGKWVFHDENR